MNIPLLKLTHRNLSGWLTKCREETVTADKKLEIIMFALSDICTALGTDGTKASTLGMTKSRVLILTMTPKLDAS